VSEFFSTHIEPLKNFRSWIGVSIQNELVEAILEAILVSSKKQSGDNIEEKGA
jgi:hypothetical protein